VRCCRTAQVIDFHMGTGARATKKVQPVLGGFDASRYTTLRLWAPTADGAPEGAQIPISVVYRWGRVARALQSGD
jgi:oligopeptidase B